MKKQWYFNLLVLFLVASSVGFAQNKNKGKYISSKGYWVIESNLKAPRSNAIYFYNNDNVMVYQEKTEGIKINTDKRKTLLKLKAALEQAIVACENGRKESLNGMLVITAFKK